MTRTIILLGMLFSAFAFAVDCKGTKDKEGQWEGLVTCPWPWGSVDTISSYRAGTLHGPRKKFGAQGGLIAEETFRNGVLDGIARYYSEQHGSLTDEKEFKEGKRHGMWKTFRADSKDGKLETIVSYRLDKKHGPEKRFHSNGLLEQLDTWADDERNGTYERYRDDGTPEERGTYREGKKEGAWTQYYVNGKRQYVRNYQRGESHGLFFSYHDNGQLLSTACYQKDAEAPGLGPCTGTGKGAETVKSFFGDGKLQVEYRLVEGKRNGFYRSFHPNGKLQEEASYENDLLEGVRKRYRPDGKLLAQLGYAKGEVVGTEKRFHENGNLATELEWKDGLTTLEKTYFQNGKLEQEKLRTEAGWYVKQFHDDGTLYFESAMKRGAYGQDRFEGIAKYYHRNGKVSEDTTYKDGEPDGVSHSYWENGKVSVKTVYEKGAMVSRALYDDAGRTLSSEELNPDGSKK